MAKLELIEVTGEEAADKIQQAIAAGGTISQPGKVVWFSDELGGLYAVEDDNEWLFLEDSAGLFIPVDREELIDQLADFIAE